MKGVQGKERRKGERWPGIRMNEGVGTNLDRDAIPNPFPQLVVYRLPHFCLI